MALWTRTLEAETDARAMRVERRGVWSSGRDDVGGEEGDGGRGACERAGGDDMATVLVMSWRGVRGWRVEEEEQEAGAGAGEQRVCWVIGWKVREERAEQASKGRRRRAL